MAEQGGKWKLVLAEESILVDGVASRTVSDAGLASCRSPISGRTDRVDNSSDSTVVPSPKVTSLVETDTPKEEDCLAFDSEWSMCSAESCLLSWIGDFEGLLLRSVWYMGIEFVS